MNYKDNNPKTLVGATKVPLELVPPSAKHYLAEALADGAKKYGPYNWRSAPVSMSIYKAACERHLDAYWDGEDTAHDSGVHHLAHAMACLAIVLDAQSCGMLVDDRPAKGRSPFLQGAYHRAEQQKLEDMKRKEHGTIIPIPADLPHEQWDDWTRQATTKPEGSTTGVPVRQPVPPQPRSYSPSAVDLDLPGRFV